METKIITEYQDFLGLKDIWNQVLDRSTFNVVFLTFEWLQAWWEDYGQGQRLFIVLVKDKEEIVGLAPLMITDKKKLQFIGHEVSDYMDFIIARNEESCFDLIFKAIKEAQNAWDWAELVYLPENSHHIGLWRLHVGQFSAANKFFGKGDVSVELDLKAKGSSWEDMERGLRGKKRNDLKRCAKLLGKIGELELVRYRTFDEIRGQFTTFVENHRRRWSTEKQGSQFDRSQQIKHYLNVAEKLAANGWVELSGLKVKGEYLAMAFGYTYNGRYYYYTPTFNPDYWRYSPGNLLVKNLIDSFYKDGSIRIFDLLRGPESYKYAWSQDENILYKLVIYPKKISSIYIYLYNQIILFGLTYFKRIPGARRIKHLITEYIKNNKTYA